MVERAYRLISTLGDPDEAARAGLLTPDATFWDPRRGEIPAAAYVAAAQAFNRNFAEPLEMVLVGSTTEDDRVVLELECEVPLVNGRVYRNHYLILFRFEGDRIASVREYIDTLHVDDIVRSLRGDA
jgi:ketosteroid isomerase-like protein